MEIIVVGLNHKSAPVQLRERLSFSRAELPSAYTILSSLPSIRENLILSTCNRVELYGVVDNSDEGTQALKEFLRDYHKVALEEFEGSLYVYQDRDAMLHLFNVASGLDSMVIGETQILGQLKEAYLSGLQNNSVGRVLDGLLQKAFSVAKEVRGTTDIAKGLVSVGSVAVRLAEEILGNLAGRKVMIVGAGKISGLVLKYLASKEVSSILVSNRTYEKACGLAQKFGGEAVRFDRLEEFLVKADIVISSTSAPHFVLKQDDISKVMEKRKDSPLILIDLAVPRDIEPAAGEIDSVYLYDIDDLQRVVEENISLRQREIEKCHRIIEKYTDGKEIESDLMDPAIDWAVSR